MSFDDAMLEAMRLLGVLAKHTSVSPDTVVVIAVTRGQYKPLGLASNAESAVVGDVLRRSLTGYIEAHFDNADNIEQHGPHGPRKADA